MQRILVILCGVMLLFLASGCTDNTTSMPKSNNVDVTEDVRRDTNDLGNNLGDDIMNATEGAADRLEDAAESTKDAAINAGDAVRDNVENYREANQAAQ